MENIEGRLRANEKFVSPVADMKPKGYTCKLFREETKSGTKKAGGFDFFAMYEKTDDNTSLQEKALIASEIQQQTRSPRWEPG